MKPYLIVNIIEGCLGVIKERATWDEALDCAVELAVEQQSSSPLAESIQAIREELEADQNWISSDGTIKVYLAQVDD